MNRDDFLLVGRIARAHGNRGEVIVNPETDFADDRFQVGRVVVVGSGDAPRAITAVRFHQGRPIIALAGIDTMDDAEALAGADLWMREDAIPPLPEGTFYRHDLVGCEVRDTRDAVVGTVTAVEGPIEQSRLIVANQGGEVLIPLVAPICVDVNVRARLIVVDPPEGLLDVNARRER